MPNIDKNDKNKWITEDNYNDPNFFVYPGVPVTFFNIELIDGTKLNPPVPYKFFKVNNGVPGAWSANIEEISPPPDSVTENIRVYTSQQSDKVMDVNSDKERYVIGDVVKLSAYLYKGEGQIFSSHASSSGEPIDNAMVAGVITTGLSDTVAFWLENKGNGLYEYSYTPTDIGSYKVTFFASDVGQDLSNFDPTKPINKEFFITSKHSFYVGADLKPVNNSGYKLIQDALNKINELLSDPIVNSISNKEKGNVNKAVKSIQSALNLKNFLKQNNNYDYNRLSDYGLEFYDDITNAINYLLNVMPNPATTSTIIDAFNLLYEGSKTFAEFAIEDAKVGCVVSNCDQVIASATSSLDKAFTEYDKGNYQNAENQITNAWKDAEQALGANLKKESIDNSNNINLPTEYGLSQNYPNPFNPSTTIDYQIPEKNFVSLKIYDILGRVVATLVDKEMNPGYYSANWNAGNLASGIYFYRLSSGSFVSTKKLMLIK